MSWRHACRPSDISEIDQAGIALNRLAGRVDELLGLEREEVADLAHRLRTPVAALRLDSEALPAMRPATGCATTSTGWNGWSTR